MKIFTPLFFTLLVAFQIKAQRIVNYNNSNNSFRLEVDSVPGSKSDCHATLILVYDKANEKLLQTITPPDNVLPCTLDKKQMFLLQDFNFDGFSDFMIPQEIPASPNIPYYYWRFNNKTQQFQRDTTLEDITSPDFDPDNKVITSFWRASCCDHGVSTYKYLNGKITLIEESETSPDPDHDDQEIFTHKKLINGELKLIEQSVSKKDKDDKSPKDKKKQ